METVKKKYVRKIKHDHDKYRKIGSLHDDGKYLKIKLANPSVWKRLHVHIAEQQLGRNLIKGEQVHHIDMDSYNNDPDNLIVVSHSEHSSLHHNYNKLCGELFRKGLLTFCKETKSYKIVGTDAVQK